MSADNQQSSSPFSSIGACHVNPGDTVAVMLRRWARCRPPMERYLAVDEALMRTEIQSARTPLPPTVIQANAWMMASVLLDESVQWALPRWAKARFGHWVRMGGIHTGVLPSLGTWLEEEDCQHLYDAQTQQAILDWAKGFPVALPHGWFENLPTPQALAYVLLLVTLVVPNGPLSLGVWPWHQWVSCSLKSLPDDSLLADLVVRYHWVIEAQDSLSPLMQCRYFDIIHALQPALSGSVIPPPDAERGRWESRPRWGAVLVEGISEQYVVPALANVLGAPLWLQGLDVVAAGGKHPMVSLVATLKEQYYLGPLAVLLDADGETEASVVSPLMEAGDTLLCLPCGALEDTYTDALLVAVINAYFQPVEPLTEADIALARTRCPAAKTDNLALMAELWQFYELSPPDKPGSFDKVMLAQCVAEYITQQTSSVTDVSAWFSNVILDWLRLVMVRGQQARLQALPTAMLGNLSASAEHN